MFHGNAIAPFLPAFIPRFSFIEYSKNHNNNVSVSVSETGYNIPAAATTVFFAPNWRN